LANIKSAMKRARQNEKRRTANRIYRSSARTYVKKVRRLVEAGDLEGAEVQTASAIRALDIAAQKGIIHRNNAARRKSRLVRLLREAQAVPVD
jgi:small subunit ribosomal protein S20